MPNSSYWLARTLADEKRAHAIANEASAEIAQMYRRQYLKVVKEVTELKAEVDSGKELTRTQLWNYSRWRGLERELQGFVSEATRMQTGTVHEALTKVFERVIGRGVDSFADSRFLLPVRAEEVISTAWSGKHYSERIWTNQAAIADRIKNSMEDMLVQGRDLPELKKQIMKEFDVAYNAADNLVRTEAAYVLNKASVDRYRRLGLKKVRWSVGPEDGKECATCAARANKVYLIDSAPMIPAHPRCRCIYAGVVELDGEDVPVDGPEAEAQIEAMKGLKPLKNRGESGIIEQRRAEIREHIKSDAVNKKVNSNKQGRHIRGSKDYIQGRSYLYEGEDVQALIDKYCGTGSLRMTQAGEWNRKEIIVVDHEIGVIIDPRTGIETATNRATIHYSKSGVHIVPAKPGVR